MTIHGSTAKRQEKFRTTKSQGKKFRTTKGTKDTKIGRFLADQLCELRGWILLVAGNFRELRGWILMNMVDAWQVCTTVDDREVADRIAQALIARRLAACVQITGPVTSVYRWQGKVESNWEWLCIIKTRPERYPALEAAIRELHPYRVPEIVATPIVAVAAEYLTWLRQETEGESIG